MTPILKRTILASTFCLGILLLPTIFTSSACAQQRKIETRVLTFPDKSIGGLYLASDIIQSGRDVMRTAIRVGHAAGKVTLKVKPNETVLVDLNQEAFLHPELLRQVSPRGIDRLRFSFYAMDDKSPLHCDDALKELPRFKDLIALDVDRSDATDKGLTYAAGMPKLVSISGFASEIRGKCFKALQACPNLRDVETDHCPIEAKYFQDLANIPKLDSVKLRQTNLDDNILPVFAKCTAMVSFDISLNQKVTDKSIVVCKSFHRLKRLEIKGTGVTINGLRALKGLPLEILLVPATLMDPASKREVHEIFPKIALMGSGKSVVTDDFKHMFAPLGGE
jgi:hypothetical protein